MTAIKSMFVVVAVTMASTSVSAWGQTSDCDTGEEATVVFQYLSVTHWGANGLRLLSDGRYDTFSVAGRYEDLERQWNPHIRLTPEEVAVFEGVLASIDFSGLQDAYDSEAMARDSGPTNWCVSIGGEVRSSTTYNNGQAPELQTAYDALQAAVTHHYEVAVVTSEWSLDLEGAIEAVEVPCDPETIPALRELIVLLGGPESEFGARDETPSAHEVLTMVRLLDGFVGSTYRLWSDDHLTIESGSLQMHHGFSEEEMSSVRSAIEAIDWSSVADGCPPE